VGSANVGKTAVIARSEATKQFKGRFGRAAYALLR
jgi:hypothetical protein